MFVRFTTESGNTNRNWGFQNALIATATANSGFTPSLPDGCISYQVLSNDEAGGWVQNTDWCDPLVSGTDTAGNIAIMAPITSKDFGIDQMSKHIRFTFDQTNGDWSAIHVGHRIPDGTYSANTNPLSTSIASHHYKDDSTNHPTDWFLSITSEYCWIWRNGVPQQHFLGVADFDGVPPAYKSVSNYWTPYAYFGTFAGTNQSKYQAYYPMNGVFSNYRGSSNLGPMTAGTYVNHDCSNSSTLYFTPSIPEVTIYTYDGTANPGSDVFHQCINTDGYYTDSLNPLAIYGPAIGFPYMPLKGIKAVGRFVGSSGSDVTSASTNYQTYVNKIVYDENGDRYMIVHSNYWAPVAFRCV